MDLAGRSKKPYLGFFSHPIFSLFMVFRLFFLYLLDFRLFRLVLVEETVLFYPNSISRMAQPTLWHSNQLWKPVALFAIFQNLLFPSSPPPISSIVEQPSKQPI